jgi:hypothetical protein
VTQFEILKNKKTHRGNTVGFFRPFAGAAEPRNFLLQGITRVRRPAGADSLNDCQEFQHVVLPYLFSLDARSIGFEPVHRRRGVFVGVCQCAQRVATCSAGLS